MTDLELVAELERLRKAVNTAEPGEGAYLSDRWKVRTKASDICYIVIEGHPHQLVVGYCDAGWDGKWGVVDEDEAAYIVAANNAMPRLLELAREAIAAMEKDGAK